MAPRALASALASGLAIAGGLLVSGCAGSSSSSRAAATSTQTPGASPARLSVAPARGKPTTAFSFSFTFTAPHATGRQGHTRLGYELAVLGPARTGCLPARTTSVPGASTGQPVTVTLDPAKLGGVWCQGDYKARVSEVQTPVCSAGQLCPQYIRLVAIVALGTFQVLPP